MNERTAVGVMRQAVWEALEDIGPRAFCSGRRELAESVLSSLREAGFLLVRPAWSPKAIAKAAYRAGFGHGVAAGMGEAAKWTRAPRPPAEVRDDWPAPGEPEPVLVDREQLLALKAIAHECRRVVSMDPAIELGGVRRLLAHPKLRGF